jgi:hypothetical protein
MTAAEYVDVASVLSGDFEPPKTTVGGARSDGMRLLYAQAVNVLLGAPEAGKTLVAGAMAADELFSGGRVLWIDLDHNGAAPLLTRFREFGVSTNVLCDPSRFRLAIPEDADALMAVVNDSRGATLAVVDSIGELMPMFGANSNDADDYTTVNRRVLAAMAGMGIGVLAIDHEAKGSDSAAYGATGTMAKKRAVDGALLRVTNVRPFRPGYGGEARLSIVKDRHGYLRSLAEQDREPVICGFTLEPKGDALIARFLVPRSACEMAEQAREADLDAVRAMDPPPTNYRDVKSRLKWRDDRARAAWKAFKNDAPGVHPDAPGVPGTVPAPMHPTPYRGVQGAGAVDALSAAEGVS